jgi:TRAP-type C4-dicarboxylate transport system permease small subunit
LRFPAGAEEPGSSALPLSSGGFMKTLSAIINRCLYVLSLILFIVMFGITTINVFLRYLFNSPIPWAVELGRYSFVGVVFLGAIYVMREDGHIGLDIFIGMLPKKLKRIVVFIGRIIVVVFLITFIIQAFRMTITNINVQSAGMLIPMAIPYSFMVIGGAGMLIELVLNIIFPRRIKRDSDPTEHNVV